MKYLSAKLRLFLYLFTSLIILSCGKEQTDPAPLPEKNNRLKIISGNNQEGTFSEKLPNKIILNVIPEQGKKATDYVIDYAMVEGNGNLLDASLFPGFPTVPNESGEFSINWILGCDRTSQTVRLQLYYAVDYYSGRTSAAFILESIEVKATGKKSTATWAKACGLDIPQAHTAKIISPNGTTLYLADRKLYTSTDGGVSWAVVKGTPSWTELSGAAFNSKGWMYVFTRKQGVFVSKDMKNWEAINNGLIDYRDPTSYYVSDDLLMVSYYFDGPYISTDNGAFWKKLLVSNHSQRFHYFQRHHNGDLYLFDDWGDFFKSSDLGKTWQEQVLGYTYFISPVHDFAIGKDGYLYIGSNDATIAKLSAQTLQGTSRRYYEWNGYSQNVSQIQFYNNEVYYLVRSTPKAGVYSINNNWGPVNLNFTKTVYAYFIKPNGEFMLLSDDGLYYKNK